MDKKLKYVVNMFEVLGLGDFNDVPVTFYRIVTSYADPVALARIAHNVSERIRINFKVLAYDYVSNDGVYVVVIGDHNRDEILSIRESSWSLQEYSSGSVASLGPGLKSRMISEILRYELYRKGFVHIRQGRYLSTGYEIVKGNIAAYKLFEGHIIKVLNIGSNYYVFIDPIRTLVYDQSVKEILGIKGKGWLIDRGTLAIYSRHGGKVKVIRYGVIRDIKDKVRVNGYVINVPEYAVDRCGKTISLKEYYKCVLDALEYDDISDDEPVVFLGDEKYAYPPSILYPVARTEDLRGEKKEMKKVYFLEPKERFSKMYRIRDLLASIKIRGLPMLKLSGNPVEFSPSPMETPKLLVGNNKGIELSLDSSTAYRDSILKALRSNGPYHVALRPGRPLAVFTTGIGISDEMILKLYEDIVKYAGKDFGVTLPGKDSLVIKEVWEIDQIEDIIKNFPDTSFALAILESDKEEMSYIKYKRIFNKYEIPSQIITMKIFNWYYEAATDKKVRRLYRNALRNLVAGLLGKMGVKLWVLEGKLIADAYIGYDIGHKPSREYPSTAVFVAVDNKGSYIATHHVSLGQVRRLIHDKRIISEIHSFFSKVKKRLGNPDKMKIVVHKDGDVYSDDIKVFTEVASSLGIDLAMVSIKKKGGYRIYELTDSSELTVNATPTGAYVILDDKKGLLISVGREFVKQGMPVPLLIELCYVGGFNYTITDAIREVFLLSFIHWQTVTSKTKMPASVGYADEWAYLIEEEIDYMDVPPL
ncbi:MAG: hypothetical protein DRO40_08115 [Thermoprotei archaeon]|nr:MAG: hypothetical protein DRO40_08115 [Thermoprotei archaeon]